MLKDNRYKTMKGIFSDPKDRDDCFRELCKHFKKKIGEVKAATKTQGEKFISKGGLIKVLDHFDLKWEGDSFKDEFKVWYQENGEVPCEMEAVGGEPGGVLPIEESDPATAGDEQAEEDEQWKTVEGAEEEEELF